MHAIPFRYFSLSQYWILTLQNVKRLTECCSCACCAQSTSLPEEKHDGKRLVGQRCERHSDLDGLLQELLADAEVVVADLVTKENVPTGGALLQQEILHVN